MGIQFPTWGKAGDSFNAGPYKFEHDGIGWKRKFVRYEEMVAQADTAAQAAADAAAAQVEAEKLLAEQAKADALAAQAAAEAAALATQQANAALTLEAPGAMDTFKEIAASLENDPFFSQRLGGLTLWKGTQAEYDALGIWDDNTLYFISG